MDAIESAAGIRRAWMNSGRVRALVVCASVLAACGGWAQQVSAAATQAALPPKAARIVACYEPLEGFGLERGKCSRIARIDRVREGVWRFILRRPPVYCVRLTLNSFPRDGSTEIRGLGELDEVRCPASAYPKVRPPDVRVPFLNYETGKRSKLVPGTASLTAVGPNRTRVLVQADVDAAWIVPGTCGGRAAAGRRFDLADFHSFRSVTSLRVPLRELTRTPHALYVDSGGAHGGVPIACAQLGGG